ncbi:MAG TPA: GNAT family N-acetyltransferase [Mucilaginibacter sp.]|nr:GNAT family N-acetyltransferase [Mucilaginibacter sp.]
MPPLSKSITIKRTEADDPDFAYLVAQLNLELKSQFGELQLVYDKYNQISKLATVVIAYVNDAPVGCGCFRKAGAAAELKRMYVKPSERKSGIASAVLGELETWAKEEGYSRMILETAVQLSESIAFYKNRGYHAVPNYGPYAGMDTSVCFEKRL